MNSNIFSVLSLRFFLVLLAISDMSTVSCLPNPDQKTANKVGSVADKVSAGAAAVAPIPIIGQGAALVSGIAAGIGAIAPNFGKIKDGFKKLGRKLKL